MHLLVQRLELDGLRRLLAHVIEASIQEVRSWCDCGSYIERNSFGAVTDKNALVHLTSRLHRLHARTRPLVAGPDGGEGVWVCQFHKGGAALYAFVVHEMHVYECLHFYPSVSTSRINFQIHIVCAFVFIFMYNAALLLRL